MIALLWETPGYRENMENLWTTCVCEEKTVALANRYAEATNTLRALKKQVEVVKNTNGEHWQDPYMKRQRLWTIGIDKDGRWNPRGKELSDRDYNRLVQRRIDAALYVVYSFRDRIKRNLVRENFRTALLDNSSNMLEYDPRRCDQQEEEDRLIREWKFVEKLVVLLLRPS